MPYGVVAFLASLCLQASHYRIAPATFFLQAAIVPPAAVVPPLPSWARETNALASYAGGRNMMFMYNQKLVADANATGTIYDVAFMGRPGDAAGLGWGRPGMVRDQRRGG